MDAAIIIGSFAAVCSTMSFAPQAWKIIRTRETKDISAAMYMLTVLGFALWTIYGVFLAQWPLVASNGICLGFAIFILVMKLMPAAGKNAVADAVLPGGDKADSP
jgi:MtN3 and saliva related transmembrane protein